MEGSGKRGVEEESGRGEWKRRVEGRWEGRWRVDGG